MISGEYREWLESALNAQAEACAAYTSSAGESPSESMSAAYSVLSQAWDALRTLVDDDSRYRVRPDLQKVINEHGTGEEVYRWYVNKLDDIYGSKVSKLIVKKLEK